MDNRANLTERYKIPLRTIEVTKANLRRYENELAEKVKGGERNG